MFGVRFLLICTILLSSVFTGHGQKMRKEYEKKVTFCKILKKTKKYEKKSVKFTATYYEFFWTGTFLSSSDCKGKFMEFKFSNKDSLKFLQMKEKIEKNLKEDKDGLSKKVTLEVYGYLERDSKEYVRSVKGLLQHYVIIIESVFIIN